MPERKNADKSNKDDKALKRPPIAPPRLDSKEREEMGKDEKTSVALRAFESTAVTLKSVSKISDSEDYLILWQKKKKMRKDISADELLKLHGEYPSIAKAIQKYRNGKDESPVPDIEHTKEAPQRKNEKLVVKTKKPFEKGDGQNEGLNYCLLTGGDAHLGKDNCKRADTLLNNLNRVQAFFEAACNERALDIHVKKKISSSVTGKKSEKVKTLNMTKAKITEEVINQFCDIIYSEDEYEKRLESSEYGLNRPGIESIRAKYEALRKFFETFSIMPEHLISQNITGRKSQMTVVTKYIAF